MRLSVRQWWVMHFHWLTFGGKLWGLDRLQGRACNAILMSVGDWSTFDPASIKLRWCSAPEANLHNVLGVSCVSRLVSQNKNRALLFEASINIGSVSVRWWYCFCLALLCCIEAAFYNDQKSKVRSSLDQHLLQTFDYCWFYNEKRGLNIKSQISKSRIRPAQLLIRNSLSKVGSNFWQSRFQIKSQKFNQTFVSSNQGVV
jgi:hypothetical protein